jgi:hypothetical protein
MAPEAGNAQEGGPVGAAYYIVLENKEPGFDTMVNGKAISRDARALSKLCVAAGIADINDFVSVTEQDMADLLGFDVDEGTLPEEESKWFTADEGLAWIESLRASIGPKRSSLKNADAVNTSVYSCRRRGSGRAGSCASTFDEGGCVARAPARLYRVLRGKSWLLHGAWREPRHA